MAFNLIAQLQIQAPTNLGRVASQIRGQLKNITATVDVKINPTSVAGINNLNQQVSLLNTNLRQLTVSASGASAALSGLGRGFAASSSGSGAATKGLAAAANATANYAKAAEDASNATEEFGRAAGLAGRRFLGFSLVAGSVVGAISALKDGISEALKFEREFIKLTQIGGATKNELAGLNTEITRLSTNLGVSSKELVGTAVTLRQAGLSVKEVTSSMEVLAKTTLAPTFDNIKDTTEGAIAVMAQFKLEAKDLETALGSANAVAAAFAVESKDIITAVQRAGGAFKSVGGDLNEFIALFTSVRQTTRESAEAISTGLRTVFTRLQRKDTVEALKDLGVNLRYTREEAAALGAVDLESQFVGAFEATRRLSEGLKNLRSTDPRYAEVVEQLGGYRQISRVLPLLQQFAVSQKALNIAQSGFASITTSAEEAQGAFLVKLQKVKEEFLALTRTIASSNAFQGFLDTSLKMAKAFLQVGEALAPIIPLITTLATIKLASNITSFFSGVTQGFGGVGPKRLAAGGVVPGSGSGDTVPAMLTPGEFVINKRAAQSIGYGKLAKANKYAAGGTVQGADTFKVGDYNLSANNVKWLYQLAAQKDKGESLLRNPNNQRVLDKLLGPSPKGGVYENANQVFEKLGFAVNSKTGVVQSLSEFRKSINQGKEFVAQRSEAIKTGQYVKNGKLLLPFKGETIGFLSTGVAGGEAGKTGRDTLNAGVRSETLGIDNVTKKVNLTASTLLKNAGVKEVAGGVNVHILGSEPTADFQTDLVGSVQDSIQNIYQTKFGAGRVAPLNRSQINSITGYLFEKYIEGVSGKFTAGNEEAFEYTRTNPGSTLGKAFDKFVFPSPITDTYLDAKSRFNRGNIGDVMKKYLNVKSRDGGLAAALGTSIGKSKGKPSPADELKFASGGVVPGYGTGDIVPARLTPGEFVIKKSSAQAIGYDKLSQLNQGGFVQKFATGGKVLEINPPKDKVGLLYLDNPDFSSRGSSGNVRYILDAKDIIDRRTKGGGGAANVLTGQGADQASIDNALAILRGGLPPNGKLGALPNVDINNYVKSQALSSTLKTSLKNQLKLGRGAKGGTFIDDYVAEIAASAPKLTIKNSAGINRSSGKFTTAPNDNVAVNIETRGVSGSGGANAVAGSFDLAIKDSIALLANNFGANFPSLGLKNFGRSDVKDSLIKSSVTQQGKGRLFEAAVRVIANRQSSKISDNFDFTPIGNNISNIFGGGLTGVYGDAKISNSRENIISVARKAVREFGNTGSNLTSLTGAKAGLAPATINKKSSGSPFAVEGGNLTTQYFQKFATGGSVEDTVPAMLTPGEFVINKQSANRIGVSNLNQMNRTGQVRGYNKGGYVQHFATGGSPRNVQSSSEINKGLNSGEVVKLSLPELSDYLTTIKSVIGELTTRLGDATTAGDADKVKKYTEQIQKVEDEFLNLTNILSGVDSKLKQVGTDFTAIQELALQKDAKGKTRYYAPGTTLQTGENLESAVSSRQDAARLQQEQEAERRKAVNDFRLNQLTQEAQDARDGIGGRGSLRTIASQRLEGSKAFNAFTNAQQNVKDTAIGVKSGEVSDATFNETKAQAQDAKAKLLEAISKEEAKVKQDLINAEKKRIKALDTGISKQEIANIAQENVSKALLLGSKVIIDNNGKVSALALTIGKTEAALKLTKEQAEKLAAAELKMANEIANGGTGAPGGGTGNKVGGLFSKVAERAQGIGLIGLSLGASYGSQAFENTPADIESAARGVNSGSVTGKAGASGALTGAAAGASIGTLFGPWGIAIGAAAGAVYGYTDSIKKAEKDIRDAKISSALVEFSETLDSINKSDRSPTALDKDKIASQVNTIRTQINANAAEEASGIITSFDVKKFNDLSKKEERASLGKELPGVYEVLNRESAKLGESFAKTTLTLADFDADKAKKSLEALDAAFIESNRELLTIVASIKKTSVEEAAKDFKKGRLQGFSSTRVTELRQTNSVNIAQELGSFLRLAEAVDRVASGLGRLEAVSTNLTDVFEGTISNTLVTRGNLRGLSNNDFKSSISGISGAFSGNKAAGSLVDYSSQFTNIKDTLGQVLPGILGGSQLEEGVDIGTAIRNELERALGERAKTPAAKAILGSIQSTAEEEGFQKLKLSSKGNIRGSIEKLTSESSPLSALDDINKRLNDSGNKFVNELIRYQGRIQRVGEQEDRVRQAQLNKLRGVLELEASKRGERGGAIDRISLEELQAPQRGRLERLTQLGGSSEDVGAIGDKLKVLNVEIEKATVAQQKAFQSNFFANDASQQAAEKLSDLKRQSADLQTALKDLTDVSTRNAAIQEKLNRIQEDRSSRLTVGEKFFRADAFGKAQFNRDAILTNQVVTKGNLDNLQPQLVNRVLDFLDSLGNSKVNFGGKELTASDIKGNLIRNSANGVFDVKAESKKQEDSLIKEASLNFSRAVDAQKLIVETTRNANDDLLQNLRKIQTDFFAELSATLSKEDIAKDYQELAKLNIEQGELKNRDADANKIRNVLGAGTTQTNIETFKNSAKEVESLIKANKNVALLEEKRKAVDTSGFEYNASKLVNGGNRIAPNARAVNSAELEKSLRSFITKQTVGTDISDEKISEAIQKIFKTSTAPVRGPASLNPVVPSGNSDRILTGDATLKKNLELELDSLLFSAKVKAEEDRTKSSDKLKAVLPERAVANIGKLTDKSYEDLTKALSNFTKDKPIDKLAEEINKLSETIKTLEAGIAGKKAALPGGAPAGFGAIRAAITKADGGAIFAAKGSDTVPAMLTPGEYVINARSAGANRGLLEKINSAKGKVNYLANGGPVLAGFDPEFGKFITSLSDRGFDYIYKLGAPELVKYYSSLQRGAIRGQNSGKGVSDAIAALARIPNPDNRSDKQDLLQKLPPNVKSYLQGRLNKLSADFESYDKATPQQLLSFYTNTVYPYMRNKTTNLEPKLKQIGNLVKLENNPEKAADLQKRYEKLDAYVDVFRTGLTPKDAKTLDLTPGTADRQRLLNVIKRVYYGGTEAPDLTVAARNLAQNNPLLDKVVGAAKKKEKNREDLALRAADKKQNAQQVAAEKQAEIANIQAAKTLADYNELFLEDRQYRTSLVQKYSLAPGSENKLEQFAMPEGEANKLKDFKRALGIRKKLSDIALEKGKKLNPVGGYEALIATRAANITGTRSIDFLSQELIKAEKAGLEAGETVEEKAKKILEQKNLLKTAEDSRRNGGKAAIPGNLTAAERALAEQKQLADIQASVRQKNNINAFVDQDKIGLDFNRERIAEREKLLKIGLEGKLGQFNDRFAEGIPEKLESMNKLVDTFNKWKISLENLGAVQGVPGRDASTEYSIERIQYNELLQLIAANKNQALPQARKFATGGFVGGSGFGDTVPAMLTPGEFVINKQAAKNIGLANLHHMNNAARFATGGPVGAGATSIGGGAIGGGDDFSQVISRFEASTSILNTAFAAFSNSANVLAQAMARFPSTITGSFTHTMNVNINGAEALAALTPEMEKIALSKAKQVLGSYVKNNLPEAGLVE